MKILEAQSAVLTNYEVYQHLTERKFGQKKRGERRGPGNLEALAREVNLIFFVDFFVLPFASFIKKENCVEFWVPASV